jgi:hypothetical protein
VTEDAISKLIGQWLGDLSADVKATRADAAEIKERTARIEERTGSLADRVDAAERDIDALDTKFDEHQGRVRWVNGWIAGAIAVVSSVGGIIATHLDWFKHLWGK